MAVLSLARLTSNEVFIRTSLARKVYITTFATHRRLYRFKWLLGVTLAPQNYQQIVPDLLSGC